MKAIAARSFCRVCRASMLPGELSVHTVGECREELDRRRAARKQPPGGLHMTAPPRPRPAGFGTERWLRIKKARDAAARKAEAAA